MSRPEPSARIRLRDIMLKRYLRLGEEHTVSEVMGFLSDPRFQAHGLPYLVVIDRDGSLAGMLPAKAVFHSLLKGHDGAGDDDDQAFLDSVDDCLRLPVKAIMNTDIPQLSPDDCLDAAFLCVHETGAEVIALIEEGRIVGLLTARILFETACQLTVGALSGGVIPPGSAPA
jgi:CBS domain-containing protein